MIMKQNTVAASYGLPASRRRDEETILINIIL